MTQTHYFFRHAEKDEKGNITPKGMRHSENMGRALCTHPNFGQNGVVWEFTSPFQRARDTRDGIKKGIGNGLIFENGGEECVELLGPPPEFWKVFFTKKAKGLSEQEILYGWLEGRDKELTEVYTVEQTASDFEYHLKMASSKIGPDGTAIHVGHYGAFEAWLVMRLRISLSELGGPFDTLEYFKVSIESTQQRVLYVEFRGIKYKK